MPSAWVTRALAGELPGKSYDRLAPVTNTVGPDDSGILIFDENDWDRPLEGMCAECLVPVCYAHNEVHHSLVCDEASEPV